MDPIDVVFGYHELTKHHPHRYARGPAYMDWATQPDPFRRFHGAPEAPLLLSEASADPPFDALCQLGALNPRPVVLETVSEFFQYALGLSAWKEYRGSRWALRINPSSGNLHPTEGYVALGSIPRLTTAPGVFHYAPKDHVLERRCEIAPDDWDDLIDGFPAGSFLVGLSSIHWREAWKYGERAYRYCQHDVGHAIAALALSAAVQGWRVQQLIEVSDENISAFLGLDRECDFADAEREHPDLLIAVMPIVDRRINDTPLGMSSASLGSVSRRQWHGVANCLSSDHVEWGLIDSVTDAGAKSAIKEQVCSRPAMKFSDPLETQRSPVPSRTIIQQRRSAVAMDGRTGITADQFYLMLDRTLPRYQLPPWRALGPPAHVNLGLFVHRVENVTPGLYFLVRSPDPLSKLRESMCSEFEWNKLSGCSASLPLYHLKPGDVRAVAGQVSCGQDIAADGAFSLGMIAEFEGPLKEHGAWMYRRLFWETGIIGQVLYLEAEAAGVRSTGIGCFLDDPVHELFGFKNRKYQSLYHFTVGAPIEDTRLTTLPPYPQKIHGRSGTAD